MIYRRRYLQFNELVFDGYDMIAESEGGVDFKINSTEYSFGHGDYMPLKRNYLFAKAGNVSLTIKLRMKKLPCDVRPFYRDFAIGELTKPGKLWAVQNNQIVWAYAVLENYSEDESSPSNRLDIDVDFFLPEGVWHKANKHKTFLIPYDVCAFMDCKKFRVIDDCNCCEACGEKEIQKRRDESCDCCCEGDLSKEMALCYNLGKIQDFYSYCRSSYQIVYDCEKGEELFGYEYLGYKLCVEDSCEDSVIAGQFFSDTDIPTDRVDIAIKGKMHNPWIEINGNRNIIEGDYDGTLAINHDGTVYYYQDCCETLLDPSKWVIPTTNDDYGWEVHQGFNDVVVHLNACCGVSCVYIQVDSLTI